MREVESFHLNVTVIDLDLELSEPPQEVHRPFPVDATSPFRSHQHVAYLVPEYPRSDSGFADEAHRNRVGPGRAFFLRKTPSECYGSVQDDSHQ